MARNIGRCFASVVAARSPPDLEAPFEIVPWIAGFLLGFPAADVLHVGVRLIEVWNGGFESATDLPWTTSLLHLVGIGALLIVVDIVACGPVAVGPFFIMSYVLLRLTRRPIVAATVSGLATAATIAPFLERMRPKFFDTDDAPFWPTVMSSLPLLIFCGLVGGWICGRVVFQLSARSRTG